jgi:uncharacterized protein (DUF433 family)
MVTTFEPLAVPLTTTPEGEVRISGSRIPLHYLIYDYRNGATAEDIVATYPSLKLSEVHAVLGYYLEHKAELDSYVQEREKIADTLRQKIERRFPQQGVRERLLARQQNKE